jgi:DNA-binding NtrC family response regulator
MAKILIVDDEAPIREALSIGLSEVGHEIEAVGTAADALHAAMGNPGRFEVVLLDLRLPDRHGLDVLTELRQRGNETPVIVISADTEMSSTVRAMRDGAFDYVSKPIDLDELEALIERAIRLASRNGGMVELPAPDPHEPPGAIELIGNSSALREVFKTLGLLSASRATVLIRGESGTGKELAARALHTFSFSRSKPEASPFVAVNCAALPGTLIESELFGYKRGAFTGADRDRVGKLEAAREGTLFLDEVGEVPLETQVKLLRVLQERQFERLGETEPRAFKARVVAATHRDLEALVRAGRFREDLYFRLNVATVTLPPLRERREDIPIISERLLAQISREVGRTLKGVSAAALDRLRIHDWPGNVRELRNVLTRAAVKCRGSTINVEDLEIGGTDAETSSLHPIVAVPDANGPSAPGRNGHGGTHFPTLDDVEREHIRRALAYAQGHKGRTCDLLGISRPTLTRKIKRYSLDGPG